MKCPHFYSLCKLEGDERGRPSTSWLECAGDDMKKLGLRSDMAQDISEWRSTIHWKICNHSKSEQCKERIDGWNQG